MKAASAPIVAGTLVIANLVLAQPADAAPTDGARPRRVIVAGPDHDPIAARVQKELVALGFDTVRAGALSGCARSAVAAAAAEEGAIAAACSDGDQVGVWVSDGTTLHLRDVVVAREEGERGREITAVRAAEVTRATLALHEPTPAPEQGSSLTSTSSRQASGSDRTPLQPDPPEGWQNFDKPPAAVVTRRKPADRYAPLFSGSAGASALMGIDASVGAFSTQFEVGIFRRLALTARLEYPLHSDPVQGGSTLSVAPALVGFGVDLPLAHSSAFLIPRLGAGLGVAWIQARRPPEASFTSGAPLLVGDSTDTAYSLAGYVNFGLSMRIVGLLRIGVDGLLGTTLNRLVARDRGLDVAYWGQPLGALALRLEVMIP